MICRGLIIQVKSLLQKFQINCAEVCCHDFSEQLSLFQQFFNDMYFSYFHFSKLRFDGQMSGNKASDILAV